MKGFETGIHYLRKIAFEEGLIKESDNDDVLIQRLAKLIKAGPVIERVEVRIEVPVVAIEEEEEKEPELIAKPTFM